MLLGRLFAAIARGPQDARKRSAAQAATREAQTLLARGERAAARSRLQQALELDPEHVPARASLAVVLTVERAYPEALEHFCALEATGSLTPELLRTYVRLLLDTGARGAARSVSERARARHPQWAESWLALGLARYSEHRYAEALECYAQAAALGAAGADFHTHRAMALHHLGRFDDALAAYARALALEPGHALARFHASLTRLLRGEFEAAWPDYELRLASAALPPRARRYPRWDGAVAGAPTVLVYGEQGLGDEIMFASCVPDLQRSGVRCVLECRPALVGLFARAFPEARVYASASESAPPSPAPAIDAEIPIGSLPLHFRRAAADFPRHRGYLKADPSRVAHWRARLDALGAGLAVGISWRGGTDASRAGMRSIALEDWLPLLRTPGARFVSLQYTREAAAEVEAFTARHGIAIAHWPEALDDYEETAALVSALDLTVSVCTAVVHLAGALGREVWVLAPAVPEWRYGVAGESLPWYPSARMFRQQEAGCWAPTLTAAALALARAVAPQAASP